MAPSRCFALFPTALGTCAIAWNDIGLTGVWLPEASADALRRRVARRCEGATEAVPTGALADVVESIASLLAGAPVDLRDVPLDQSSIAAFDRRVYAVARQIAAGHVLTYGEVAARVGAGASARKVGQSLGRNAMPIVVPCHRVVAAGGGLGGFSAPGGAATKQRLLAIENARRSGPPDLFDTVAVEAHEAEPAAIASGREARAR